MQANSADCTVPSQSGEEASAESGADSDPQPDDHKQPEDFKLDGDQQQNVEEKKLLNSPIIPLDLVFEASKAVCVVEGKASGFLTSFDCIKSGEYLQGLMTNYLVLNAARIDSEAGDPVSLEFEIIREKRTQKFEIPIRDVFVFMCPLLGVCFIAMCDEVRKSLQKKTGIDDSDYLQLCRQEEDTVFVIHHPHSGRKSISYGKITVRDGFNLHYGASTNEGSSGSPLMHTTVSKRVLGVHKASGGHGREYDFNIACSGAEIINAIDRVLKESNNVKKLTCMDIATQEKHLKSVLTSAEVEYAPRHSSTKCLAYSKLSLNARPCWITPTCHGWYYTFHEPDKYIIARQHWISADGATDQGVKNITELSEKLEAVKIIV